MHKVLIYYSSGINYNMLHTTKQQSILLPSSCFSFSTSSWLKKANTRSITRIRDTIIIIIYIIVITQYNNMNTMCLLCCRISTLSSCIVVSLISHEFCCLYLSIPFHKTNNTSNTSLLCHSWLTLNCKYMRKSTYTQWA